MSLSGWAYRRAYISGPKDELENLWAGPKMKPVACPSKKGLGPSLAQALDPGLKWALSLSFLETLDGTILEVS